MKYYNHICEKCNTEYTISYKTKWYRGKNNTPDLCKNCMKEYNRSITQDYWKNTSNENKKKRNDKISNTWKNQSLEKKNKISNERSIRHKAWHASLTKNMKKDLSKKIKNGWTSEKRDKQSQRQKKYISNLSEEKFNDWRIKVNKSNSKFWKNPINKNKLERKLRQLRKGYDQWRKKLSISDKEDRSDKISKRIKIYWNIPGMKEKSSKHQRERYEKNPYLRKQASDRKKQWWANLTLEEYLHMSSNGKSQWDKLEKNKQNEEIKRLNKISEDFWNNLSIDEYNKWKCKRNSGAKHYFDNLTSDKYCEYCKKCSTNSNNYWNNLNEEGFLLWAKSDSKGIAESENKRGPTESIFANDLNKYGIEYKWGYSSYPYIHPKFKELFPYNPITGERVNPFHAWDFIIYTKQGNILVDVDGGKHIIPINNEIGVRIKFNDSQRPYQTDGMDAYIIECYDDKLENNTKVLELNTNKYISYKEFINMIQLMNYSDKELREIL